MFQTLSAPVLTLNFVAQNETNYHRPHELSENRRFETIKSKSKRGVEDI